MQDRIDALIAAGAQNVWPKFTYFVPRTPDKAAEHILVAEVLDGVVVLTPEGRTLLEGAKAEANVVDVEVVSETKKPRATKKKAEAVIEDSNEILDDLDMS